MPLPKLPTSPATLLDMSSNDVALAENRPNGGVTRREASPLVQPELDGIVPAVRKTAQLVKSKKAPAGHAQHLRPRPTGCRYEQTLEKIGKSHTCGESQVVRAGH